MANELPMETTKEKWKEDGNIKIWLTSRQEEGKEGEKSEIWKEAVKIWFDTVEFQTWPSLLKFPSENEVKKSIAYIKRTQPMATWNWRLHPEGELYVNWWCYMRKFVKDHPYLKNDLHTEEQNKELEKTRFIYPTLNKWSIFFKTEGLSIKAVQDMVLVKFAEWLLILAADRQMFRDENMRTGIPRIVISGSTKELKLDLNKEVGEIQGEIQSRDASVVYIMEECSKILSERGIDIEIFKKWEEINKKYTWLLGP
jgi:hypothetical protein|tara:strand:+ start:80 stop:844 length:765 start_codon:yes stop_codon:yes gene_type:complete